MSKKPQKYDLCICPDASKEKKFEWDCHMHGKQFAPISGYAAGMRDIVVDLAEACSMYDMRNPTFGLLKCAKEEILRLRKIVDDVALANMRKKR